MVVFNRPYSRHLVVKTPKGVKLTAAALLDGKEVRVEEAARNEYNVDMPAKDPGAPFVIRLQVEEEQGTAGKYREALT